MSTRTAVFKEMPDGAYQGIYVHNDGYIEYTGELLNKYYTGNDKIDHIIQRKYPIKSLGASEMTININESEKAARERNKDHFMKYTSTAYDGKYIKQEYFKADTIQDILTFQYLTYDENNNVQKFLAEDEFISYRGSDNNGYLYLQGHSGEWYVSYMKNSQGDMSNFIMLSNVLSK